MHIMIGIISSFPLAIVQEVGEKGTGGLLLLVLEFLALFFIVMSVVLLTTAIRRIPVQYARQVVGGSKRQPGKGQRSYIPLKVNSANVMPIIFAQSLMFLPSLLASLWADQSDTARYIAQTFATFTSVEYNVTFAILIISHSSIRLLQSILNKWLMI